MTAPTPRPSLTPLRELEQTWRTLSYAADASAKTQLDETWTAHQRGAATALFVCADELAAALKAMRCETCGTCRHWHPVDDAPKVGVCYRNAANASTTPQIPWTADESCSRHAPRTDGEG